MLNIVHRLQVSSDMNAVLTAADSLWLFSEGIVVCTYHGVEEMRID